LLKMEQSRSRPTCISVLNNILFQNLYIRGKMKEAVTIIESCKSNDKPVSYLIPRSTVFLNSLTVPQLVRKFPVFHGTKKFITVFTTARPLSLSRAREVLIVDSFLPSLMDHEKWLKR
jgi:hypothetical protein